MEKNDLKKLDNDTSAFSNRTFNYVDGFNKCVDLINLKEAGDEYVANLKTLNGLIDRLNRNLGGMIEDTWKIQNICEKINKLTKS